MLTLEYLLEKMKVHFPRWMNIRRKITSSSGGNYLSSIAENISDIQESINDYVSDFFLDKYIGHENEVITFLFKFHIGITDIDSLKILSHEYEITDNEEEFYNNKGLAYYKDGSIYLKEELEEIEYSIDGYKSISSSEKIHVWNIFDEFAAFLGLKRFLWETNRELLNRILAFANNKPNSTEIGLKNAIINNLTNIEKITLDDIVIERPTPENLNIYYNNFETILDHLSNVNRDIYRTKRWDLDTWNFNIKSIDYIPHAWDIALKYYQNGIGFDDDLKVEIVDSEMKTNADIYFYKKTLEYVNSYIKNNNIKEKITLNLKKHSDNLKPLLVKYRIEASELKELDTDNIIINSLDYKIGNIKQSIDDIFNKEINEYQDVDFVNNGILNPTKNYKLRFKSQDELKEMIVDEAYIYNTINNEKKSILENKAGFELINQYSVRCTLTKKYIAEKYHFNKIENAHKEINGFVISDAENEAILMSNADNCQNEIINYSYTSEEIPVLFQHIKRNNCYIENNSIISDTVEGEKSIELNIEANSFSCKIHGAHKIIYSIDNGAIKTIEKLINNETSSFTIERSDKPRNLNIKIVLNPKNNMQCAITDIMYSKFEFSIYTEKGEIPIIGNDLRMPNSAKNNLYVKMKTFIGFSPVLEYIYIGERVNNIVYGDIDILPEEGDVLIIKTSNCTAELDTYHEDKLEFSDINFLSGTSIVSNSNDAYIEINLKNFKKYSNVIAERCMFDSIKQGSRILNVIKIPAGVILKEINVVGEYEKLINKENLSSILKRKGYLKQYFNFYSTKTNENIVVENKESFEEKFVKIKKNDIFSGASKINIDILSNDVKAIFIDDSNNKISNITNEYDGSYDYISFYPMSTKIYKAINEIRAISKTTIVDGIINTFDNNFMLNNEHKIYYTIESLNEEFNVMFIKNSIERNYSIDTSKIKIDKKDSISLNFDSEVLAVNYTSVLGNTIDIPEYFNVNNEKVEVSKYIISNEDLDIVYLDKHSDNLHSMDYIITEKITINNLRTNKLKYCNVEEIEEFYIDNGEEKILINHNDYYLYKKEGIISWLNVDDINEHEKIFIKYNIKKAKYIRFSIDKLYDKVNYSVNAFELINKIELFEVNNNDNFNLAMYSEYEESDNIVVKCHNIGFEASVNNGILTFFKNLKNNTIAVKNGYYYLDSDEYYLFADENKDSIEHMDNLFFFNVIKENKKFYLNQTTENHVANSSFEASSSERIFNLNCNSKNIKGVSKINSITACNSFNHWKTVGMDAGIVKGLNGDGIKFTGIAAIDGYAYLNITKHFKGNDKTHVLSFYMKGDGEAYLGIEKVVYSENGEFNKQAIIDPKIKAIESSIEDNLFEIEFNKNEAKEYYLVIRGNVIVDDILIQEKEDYSIDNHIKNISHLNLDIKENIYSSYETRLYLDDTEGAILDGTEIKDNTIINSSYIDWGFTKIKTLDNKETFIKSVLENVNLINHNDKCYLATGKDYGKIITEAIYLGNVNTIKNLVFKINEVMFNHMTNFKIRVLTSSNAYTGFKEVSVHLDNMGSVTSDKLSSYIKLVVEMPSDKVINSIEIFTEYLSDNKNNPVEIPVLNGTYISKVLDAQYNSRYLLKNLSIETDTDLDNIIFEIRASKENYNNTVWTGWKRIKLLKEIDNKYIFDSRIVFDDYRYFQFKVILKGINSSVKIKHLDLEVI